jgi:hypothetical protein
VISVPVDMREIQLRKEAVMAKKVFTPEQVVTKLKQIKVLVAQGKVYLPRGG